MEPIRLGEICPNQTRYGYIPKLIFGVGPAFDTEKRDNRPYKIAETFLRYIPMPRHHIKV